MLLRRRGACLQKEGLRHLRGSLILRSIPLSLCTPVRAAKREGGRRERERRKGKLGALAPHLASDSSFPPRPMTL
eukprot:9498654-Pyramimonas_sp.AAC.1